MKTAKHIAFILGIAALAACSDEEKNTVDFALDSDSFEIGADGGTQIVKISASEEWVASTDNPWITVSPANGRGTAQCRILIDSALTNRPRTGVVRIQTQDSWEDRQIDIVQKGYDYTIEVDDNEISVDNYAAYGSRYFDVKVRTNVDFDVVIPDDAGWLSYESYKVELNRGLRPREVTVRFNWNINSMPMPRPAAVEFRPREEIALARHDGLSVTQKAAPEIDRDTRAGDSVALLGVARSLGTWTSWESSEPMTQWDNITLWEEGMTGYTPDKEGRVRSAQFMLFQTREGIPFEVQYLTAAEDLYFYSNVNSFLRSLNPGEYICELTQLKRLTIAAYGLTELPESFTKLKNLEYLDLSSNNFEQIPALLTPENFPKLHALRLSANQRSLIYDLSNNVKTNFGGLYEETGTKREFPRRLLTWNQLDTLAVSVNYLQGTLPSFEDDPSWQEFYTDADVAASKNSEGVDTLPAGRWPQGIVGLPKVLPNIKAFSINLNRLTGELPDWLLYHPALDWWSPSILVFSQEGKDEEGNSAGFSNEPANLNYYYQFYPNKKFAGQTAE